MTPIAFVDIPKIYANLAKNAGEIQEIPTTWVKLCWHLTTIFSCLFFALLYTSTIIDTRPVSANSTRSQITISGVSYPIIDQPADDWDWISEQDDVFTRFSLANYDGYTWLLAHDYLAGKHIVALKVGDVVTVDGVRYTIISVEHHEIVPWQSLAVQPGLYLQTCQGDGIMVVRGEAE